MEPAGKGFELFADLLLLFLAVFVCTSTAGAQTAGTFMATGNMTTPRTGHTATLLYLCRCRDSEGKDSVQPDDSEANRRKFQAESLRQKRRTAQEPAEPHPDESTSLRK